MEAEILVGNGENQLIRFNAIRSDAKGQVRLGAGSREQRNKRMRRHRVQEIVEAHEGVITLLDIQQADGPVSVLSQAAQQALVSSRTRRI